MFERVNSDPGGTVHPGRLEGSTLHFIDSLESARVLRVGARVGISMPAHCTSTDRALLAELGEEELHRLYPDEDLAQLTPHSIGTRTTLVAVLPDVRDRGDARSGRAPRLVINVSLPVIRMTGITQEAVIRRLFEATDELDDLLL